MENFNYVNPVRIVFGKDTIAQLAELIPAGVRVMIAYGGGSIHHNGVYDQVVAALRGHEVVEFGGIEPNPRYETLMRAVALVRERGVGFILAVGGGSVLDGVKFIAAASCFKDGDPWKILTEGAAVAEAVALGSVLTLPATGSEMNTFAVISRDSTNEKLAFGSPKVYPKFSILDPTTTFSLPIRQVSNGIVDAFVHVMEQYMTFPAAAPLQDRMAEAILATLVEVGPRVLANPADYDARASIMWAATMALNGLIAVGVPQDWTTHMIGHELTAIYGLDHAQTLAAVMPAVWRHQKTQKAAKLLQYGERIWGIREGSAEERIEAAIARTEAFFREVGVKTRLAEYGVTDGLEAVPERLGRRGACLGERADIGPAEIGRILALCAN